jgi:hypothetical protein
MTYDVTFIDKSDREIMTHRVECMTYHVAFYEAILKFCNEFGSTLDVKKITVVRNEDNP